MGFRYDVAMRGVLVPVLVAVLALGAVSYAQMPDASGAGAATASPSPSTPRRAARRARARPGNVVTLPGFQMLPDGQSRFHCVVHGVASTSQSSSRGRFEVTVANARLGLSNDRRPLEMRFFDTPVLRHYLARRGNDVALVFELRAEASGAVRAESRQDGTTAIIVEFPAGQYMSDADRRTLHEQAEEPTMDIPVSQSSVEPGVTSLSAVGTSARPAPAAQGTAPATAPAATAPATASDADTGRAAQTTAPATPQRRTPTTRTRYDPTLDALDNERPPILNR